MRICWVSTCGKPAELIELDTQRLWCRACHLAFYAQLNTIRADSFHRNRRRVLTQRKVSDRDAKGVSYVARSPRPKPPIYRAHGTELLGGAWEQGKNGRH
jgi:hypothetical protein